MVAQSPDKGLGESIMLNPLDLLNSWKLWVSLGAIIALFSSGVYEGIKWEKSRSERALQAQIEADTAQCSKDKKTTKEANDALQKDRDTIAGRLASYKRLHPHMCIKTTPNVANDTGGGARPIGGNEIDSDRLWDFAAKCAEYRSEVIILNAFGLAERK